MSILEKFELLKKIRLERIIQEECYLKSESNLLEEFGWSSIDGKVQKEFGSWRNPTEGDVRKEFGCWRNSKGVWLLEKSDCWRNLEGVRPPEGPE